ncbi:MAG: thioredoxin family protein [Acholeplasmatales bacterium]|jgi:thioredoxin 1|nr:thioredoxin family protein [Acholeplasmatales bacterium]
MNIKETILQKINKNEVFGLKFYVTWCKACKKLKPILEKLRHDDGITFIEIDVEKNRPIAVEYYVKCVPTVIIFKNGVKHIFEGYQKYETFLEAIKDV